MRGYLVLFTLLYVVAATAPPPLPAPPVPPPPPSLPDYPCSKDIVKHGENPKLDPCSNTTAFSKLFSCLDFLNDNETLPPAQCCNNIHFIWLQFPASFCRVTFFPHGFGKNSSSKFRARPLLCELTADLCSLCPAYLFPQQLGATRLSAKRTATLVTIIVGITVALLLCFLLMHWRKKIFCYAYENDEYCQHFKDIENMEGKPTIFPYSVLKTATKNFDPKCKLGEGGFGSVFKGVLPDGMEVAVKQLSAQSQQGNAEFLNEVTLITSVQHRNLVKLQGCCLKGEERLLVYEYMENRSLHQALFKTPTLHFMDWRTRMKILEGTARGLAYLHEGCQTRIVHRDIKASNILLDKDLNPKIADFGLARIFSVNDTHVSTRVAGTAGYLAPEYAMRGQLTEKADVFSFGIVALELVSGRPNLDCQLETRTHGAPYLLEWAWQLYEEHRLMDLLDPAFSWCHNIIDKAMGVIEMALMCTHSRAALRPSMTSVVSMITGGSEVLLPTLTRYNVRDYMDLPGFKASDPTARINNGEGGQVDTMALQSSASHNNSMASSNGSILEPR